MDFQAPSSQQVLDGLKMSQWVPTHFRFALWPTGMEDDARVLLREAIYCMCDPKGGMPWDADHSTVAL
jgi:hypothetical protein